RLRARAERLERHRLLHVRAAQLSHPHVERDLAALVAGLALVAGPRAGALLPAPGGLAEARALAAADALAGPMGPLRRPQRVQAVNGRLDEIDWILRAQALRQHVADPRQLQHGAHRAPGDHAGSLAGRLQEHLARAEAADHVVRDRGVVLRHLEEALLRTLDGLLDRERDLVRLAVPDPDDPILVAHHHEGREREAPAALDHLRDAVD